MVEEGKIFVFVLKFSGLAKYRNDAAPGPQDPSSAKEFKKFMKL